MIHRKQKIKQKNIAKDQRGVTLLLAVLVLSGLTLIALAMATFTVEELRSSRAIILSEPAITAAESGGEEGIWTLKRSGTIPPDCVTGASTVTALTNGTSNQTCTSLSNATFSLLPNTALQFYLYDPYDINGDVDLQGCVLCSPPSTHPSGYQYSNLTITHRTGTNSVSATVSRLDGTVLASQPISPGGSLSVNIPAVAAGAEGRIQVTLQSAANASVDVSTNKGVPGNLNFLASGCSSKGTLSSCNSTSNNELFTRKLQITVPGQ